MTYPLLVGSLLCESFAWWSRFNALKYHSLAREGARRAMLADGLGEVWDVKETQDYRQKLDGHLREVADAREAAKHPPHYTSTEPPGVRRLHLNLLESVFWHKHLYRQAAKGSLNNIALFVGGLLIILLVFMPFLSPVAVPIAAHGLIELLLFLTVWDELDQSLNWRAAAEKLDLLYEQLWQPLRADSRAIIGVADYAVATATVSPIPAELFQAEHANLDKSWREVLSNHPSIAHSIKQSSNP